MDVSLEASEQLVILGGRPARLYTYNRLAQAPRLVAYPGDTVQLELTNHLTEATNLHYHGLHISPEGNADNVFLRVEPGATRTYRFRIPVKHPGGTFWYHPHIHPNTARQVSRGLAGLFIIRGELDGIPGIHAMPEHFLVLQDFQLDASGSIIEPSMMERIQGREGNLVTTSGQINPSIPARSGEWLRLRILNASASRYYRLALEQHTLYQIATDGGAVPRPEPVSEVLLTPSERVELAVQGRQLSGRYRLLRLPYDRHSGEMMGVGMMSGRRMGGRMMVSLTTTPLTLATLQYDGSVAPSGYRPALRLSRHFLRLHSHSGVSRFSQGMHMTFTINGRTFNHDRIDVKANLDAIEDWEFVNSTGMDHPMHIHTNPFQVLDATGTPTRAWKDTVNVRANPRLRIRTRLPFTPASQRSLATFSIMKIWG